MLNSLDGLDVVISSDDDLYEMLNYEDYSKENNFNDFVDVYSIDDANFQPLRSEDRSDSFYILVLTKKLNIEGNDKRLILGFANVDSVGDFWEEVGGTLKEDYVSESIIDKLSKSRVSILKNIATYTSLELKKRISSNFVKYKNYFYDNTDVLSGNKAGLGRMLMNTLYDLLSDRFIFFTSSSTAVGFYHHMGCQFISENRSTNEPLFIYPTINNQFNNDQFMSGQGFQPGKVSSFQRNQLPHHSSMFKPSNQVSGTQFTLNSCQNSNAGVGSQFQLSNQQGVSGFYQLATPDRGRIKYDSRYQPQTLEKLTSSHQHSRSRSRDDKRQHVKQQDKKIN